MVELGGTSGIWFAPAVISWLRHPFAPRAFRAAVVLTAVILIHEQARWRESRQPPAISLRQAGRFFPEANKLQVRDPERRFHMVMDQYDEILGCLLTTSPETDHIIGYTGPNNILVAMDAKGSIISLELLKSGDTEEHVAKVRQATNFLGGFLGWKPAEEPPPPFTGVSGATLTSLAIVEAIQERIGVASPSLRFPDPVSLREVRELHPQAARIERGGERLGVFDGTNGFLGWVLRTSPYADNVSGYQGPTECLLSLNPERDVVGEIIVCKSYETPSYVRQIVDAGAFLELFRGRKVEELARFEFPRIWPAGVSGATRTSRAIGEGVKRRLLAELEAEGKAPPWRPRPRDWGLAGVIAGACLMAFSSLRRRRWVRIGWRLILVGYVGFLNHDLLSLALFGGWATHGPALRAMPGLVLLTVSALLVPWVSRRQLYCHQICPHGAAQQLLGKVSRYRFKLRPRVERALERVPSILLAGAVGALWAGLDWNLSALEPFDAWSVGAAGVAALTLALVGLAASIFVPQAYCRFGCPTGALLAFVRSSGSDARWGGRDVWAIAFLATGLAGIAGLRLLPQTSAGPEPVALTGTTMGTTWSVKIRDDLASPVTVEKAIAKEFEWAESLTSHWRTNTELSEFNRTASTNEMPMPWPVMTLVKWSEEISRETGGAYDVTVGPLVRLWGFGPGPRREIPPEESGIAAVLKGVGWEKIERLDGQLRKRHPALEVDLSSIAKGWAIDKVVHLLEFRGLTNFLVEAGGELRARGSWKVAIEHPIRPATLHDEAIATSGSYRQRFTSGGRSYSHLLDPRTGRPVTHSTVSVSVRHAECARADAWATALNVLGVEEGMPVAERLGLAVQFVVERPDGTLTVTSSTAWARVEAAERRTGE